VDLANTHDLRRSGQARQGLILDFGGVVTSDFDAALGGFCSRAGLARDAAQLALRSPEGCQALADAETGRVPQADFEMVVARLLGLPAAGLFRQMLAELQPNQAVLDYVKTVRKSGVGAAILSNSWGPGGEDAYAGYNLQKSFDVVVISDRVGLRKPDPAIYQLTADRLGLEPSQCVFVDDNEHNLPPARALGMKTVHFADPVDGLDQIVRTLNLPQPGQPSQPRAAVPRG
jgi:epoxide hydrolase-like predicted phosphatase